MQNCFDYNIHMFSTRANQGAHTQATLALFGVCDVGVTLIVGVLPCHGVMEAGAV
jgi:hypothetical protein